MSGVRCKHGLSITRYTTDGTSPGAKVLIPQDTASFTLRVVDSTGAGIAWTLATDADNGTVFDFAAGEAYSEDRLAMSSDLYVRVVAAAGVAELITWRE